MHTNYIIWMLTVNIITGEQLDLSDLFINKSEPNITEKESILNNIKSIKSFDAMTCGPNGNIWLFNGNKVFIVDSEGCFMEEKDIKSVCVIADNIIGVCYLTSIQCFMFITSEHYTICNAHDNQSIFSGELSNWYNFPYDEDIIGVSTKYNQISPSFILMTKHSDNYYVRRCSVTINWSDINDSIINIEVGDEVLALRVSNDENGQQIINEVCPKTEIEHSKPINMSSITATSFYSDKYGNDKWCLCGDNGCLFGDGYTYSGPFETVYFNEWIKVCQR